MEAVKPSDVAFDDQLATMLAQSKQAFEKYSNTLTDIEKQMIGTFYGYPPKMEGGGWIFYRVGLKGSRTAEAMAHLLRQQGWVDAPRGTKMHGTELWDGDDGGLFLCAPQEVYRRQKAVEQEALSKAAMKAEAMKMDGLGNALAGLPGVSVDKFETDAGEASLGDLTVSAQKQQSDRRQARR